MTVPHDVESLVSRLVQLGSGREHAAKVAEYLSVQPGDELRWGGVATDYLNIGKYYAANAVFVAALERFTESSALWAARGDLFRKWQKLDGAREFFLRALTLDPGSVQALFGLALLHEQAGSHTEALPCYVKLLAKRPGSVQVHNCLANCYRQLGRLDEARVHYQQALSINPKHSHSLFSYAAFLYERREFDSALGFIDRLLECDPDDVEASQLRADIEDRPEQPRKFEAPRLVKSGFIFRGSKSAGWEGPAGNPVATHVNPDASLGQPISLPSLAAASVSEIRAKAGYRVADIVELHRLLAQAVANESVPAVGDSATLFLSYRWSSEAHVGWMTEFAAELVARNYKIVFDRFVSMSIPDISVAALVSKIGQCNVFVPILSDEYAVCVEPDGMYPEGVAAVGIDQDAWVYDEFRSAQWLVSIGRMRYLPLWHSGERLPSPFYEGNVIDIRTDASRRAALDKYFPPQSSRQK